VANYKYDLFISYSHRDIDWVKNKLIPELEAHNFLICIDFIQFRTGSFGITEMERAVVESKRVLLVLTEDYVNSEWTKFESVMAQTLDPGATFRKIIPALHKTCKIPLRLQILHYRDLRLDDQQEWDLLMRDLI
jgi:hypothetical protein